MSNLCTEVGTQSLVKYGEELCGDSVAVLHPDEDTTVAVLADGLGSGVKACILSTLTAKIISTMMAREMSLSACVQAVAATLPVSREHQIAYSTFTILRVTGSHRAEVIQFDNPRVILLRMGRHEEFPVTSENIDGKTIYKSSFYVQEGDVFLAISDGVEHAGVGQSLNLSWQRADIIRFMEDLYDAGHSAHTLAKVLAEQCGRLYNGRPSDDATVCAVKVRRRVPVNLLIGPPREPEDLRRMMSLFFAKGGKHVVCGGTTGQLAAEYLGKELLTPPPLPGADPAVPPVASLCGADLVTEGAITLSRVVEDAGAYVDGECDSYELNRRLDGAAQVGRILFEEATDVNIFAGRAVNPAHQNRSGPIPFAIKMRLLKELAVSLEKMGKHVKVSYF